MSNRPPTADHVFCPQCGAQTSFASSSCGSCGKVLGEAVGGAETVEVPAIERDPEVIALWQQLRQATLGEYDVYAPLGRGGMATVFLALDLALEREVAIKVISPGMLRTSNLVERFKREARTAALLSHPNIIPVHQVKEADGLLFFVMKYVDGRSLDAIVREDGPLTLDVSADILRQVGGALDFAHRKGIVHRDVKPANIMIDQDGWAIVTDFGIAKVADAVSVTSAGMVVGTPAYMSPEQFSSQPITGAADQYSLGVVAYEMLTGRTPFGALSIADMMRAHLIDEPLAPRSVRPDLSERLSAVILRMLAKDPAARWPSIGDAVAALEPLSHARAQDARSAMKLLARSGSNERPRISVPVSPVPTRQSVKMPGDIHPARSDGRRRRWLVGLVAGGLVLGAVVAIVARQGLLRVGSERPGPSQTDAATGTVPAPRPAPTTPETTALLRAPSASAARKVAQTAVAPQTAAAPKRSDRSKEAKDSKRQGRDLGPVATDQGKGSTTLPVQPTDSTPSLPHRPSTGVVRLGTRVPTAAIYLNGKAQGFIQGLRYFTLPAGSVTIGIRAEGCDPWDSTIVVPRGDTVGIGYRNPSNCKP